uniref:Uncharacterized protein n=1 Tax=Arundo donax TaxID=35708 RepID=A0A0A8Z4V1_ARUDO
MHNNSCEKTRMPLASSAHCPPPAGTCSPEILRRSGSGSRRRWEVDKTRGTRVSVTSPCLHRRRRPRPPPRQPAPPSSSPSTASA